MGLGFRVGEGLGFRVGGGGCLSKHPILTPETAWQAQQAIQCRTHLGGSS